MTCNICKSENLIKGTVYGITGSGGGSGGSGFLPEDSSAFQKMFAMGGRDVQCYGCIHCGNMQFFIEFSEEDKQQHMEFHRQPSSVTEQFDERDLLDEKLEVSE